MSPRSFSASALVIAAHGSTLDPASGAPTRTHAETIRENNIFAEVASCFWKEAPSFRDVLQTIRSREIFVVPNFIGNGHFTRTVIPREMRLDGPVTLRDGRMIRYCDPVGSHPLMAELLVREAKACAPGVPPDQTSLIIVGHGTGLNDSSAIAARRLAGALAAREEYAEVLAAYMEEPPLVAEWDHLTTRPNVVVLPLFISDGPHCCQDIPALLGIAGKNDLSASHPPPFRHNPLALRGRQLFYGNAIGTQPDFATLILDQAIAALKSPHTPPPG